MAESTSTAGSTPKKEGIFFPLSRVLDMGHGLISRRLLLDADFLLPRAEIKCFTSLYKTISRLLLLPELAPGLLWHIVSMQHVFD